jgi:very-short-patch-repair endonuclease
MAAVLAIGRGAVLSHLSAAALWGLLRPAGGSVDISIPTRSGRRKRKGIRLHRCTDLTSRDLSRRKGIPVTTPARTIADLKRALPSGQYQRAIRQADVLGLATGLSAPPVPTRSELEDRLLALCRRHGVTEPEVNVRIGALTVDFLWRGQRLVVETDGYRYHRGESAFEHDHDRDLRLRQLGYDVLRLSYRQVTREAQTVAALIRRELAGGHSSREP